MERCRNADGGFTLIELLVTLALLGLLSLALFGSIHYGTRVWAASRAVAANADSVREAQAEIRQAISAAYPKITAQDALHLSVAVSGDAQSLHVLAPDPQLKGALDRITIRRNTDSTLVLERNLELGNRDRPKSTETLLSGVLALQFDYFGSGNNDDAPQWLHSWEGKTRTPALIRVRAALQARGTNWPDLVVRPQIAADMSCRLDAITKFCEGR